MRLTGTSRFLALLLAATQVSLSTSRKPFFPRAHTTPISPPLLHHLRAGGSASNTLPWKEVSGDPRTRFYVMGGGKGGRSATAVTYSLVGITAISFLAQMALPKYTSFGMKISEKIRNGEELYRLVTPILLHGNFQHIATNMASLVRMGGNVEALFGPGRYAAAYLIAGIAGNVCSAFASPTNSLGASGSVFGIIGAFAVFLTRNNAFLGPRGQQVTKSVLQTMSINLVMGFFQNSIDQWAHLGGAIGGAIMAFFFGPRLYYTKTPNGKTAVVDRPFWRVPAAAETIPSKISLKCNQIVSKVLGRKPPATPPAPQLDYVAELPKPSPTPVSKQTGSPFSRFWNRLF